MAEPAVEGTHGAEAEAASLVVSARGVVAGYVPEVDILNGATIEVAKGEIVSIVGPNGAGKSTLIKVIIGLVAARAGTVELEGRSLIGLPPNRIARLGVGYVAQARNVFRTLSVEENLRIGGYLASSREAGRRATAELLELFPRLAERRRQPAGVLSGGERQMLAMARALIGRPRVLLLDEPSAGLSPSFVDAVFAKIAEIGRTGVTVLMVEQNAARALAISDRGYVLDLGRTRFEGAGSKLLGDPKVRDLYLGGDRARAADPRAAD